MGYRNNYSEISNYSIIFHMSYKNALERSITMLENMELNSAAENFAREDVLNDFRTSLKSAIVYPIEEREDAYRHFKDVNGNYIKGIKLHMRTGALHLYGLVAQKRVLMPGHYPTKNESEFARAKRQLRHLTPVGKFRQFKILPNQVDHIAVANLKLLPPEI